MPTWRSSQAASWLPPSTTSTTAPQEPQSCWSWRLPSCPTESSNNHCPDARSAVQREQLLATADTGLAVGRAQVVVHGQDRQTEAAGDLLGGQSGSDESEYFRLAVAQS